MNAMAVAIMATDDPNAAQIDQDVADGMTLAMTTCTTTATTVLETMIESMMMLAMMRTDVGLVHRSAGIEVDREVARQKLEGQPTP